VCVEEEPHLHLNYHGVLSVDRCGDEGADSEGGVLSWNMADPPACSLRTPLHRNSGYI